ncbi:MAG: hypothetical protein EP329_15300 [Deltaproteobacteria bacterium]|nr:MAG: hypothetical protein EP329_15300 [Deltaproteobacteria bacterium]
MGHARPDYYAVLGVARDADAEEIRAAYKTLAARHHPDKNPSAGGASERFKVVVEAYAILRDPERRSAYDAALPSDDEVPVERAGGFAEAVGGLLDSLFGVKLGKPVVGRNRVYRLAVPFADAMLGTSQTLLLPVERTCAACFGRGFPPETVPEVCERCMGTGTIQARPFLRSELLPCPACDARGYTVPAWCETCAGKGVARHEETVRIPLPGGSATGDRLRVIGRGEPGRFGGEDGDLLVDIEVLRDARLRRDGDDVVLDRPVSVFTALAGGPVPVPTVDGPRAIRLPPCTPDGTVLRMAGYGVRREDGQRGDQRVNIRVELPERLDEDARAAIVAVAARIGDRPFPAVRAFEGDGDAS